MNQVGVIVPAPLSESEDTGDVSPPAGSAGVLPASSQSHWMQEQVKFGSGADGDA